MGVGRAAIALIAAILAAPFMAVIFDAIYKIVNQLFNATSISGHGPFAQAQTSVRQDANLALRLIELASSLQTWILLLVLILAIYAAVVSR